LGDDIIKYYNIGDFILIEGFLSGKDNLSQNLDLQKDKQFEFTVIKIFPYFVNENGFDYFQIPNLSRSLINTDTPF